jgi:hypothetical protein
MDVACEKAIEVLGEGFQGGALDLLRMIYCDTSLPMGLKARCGPVCGRV